MTHCYVTKDKWGFKYRRSQTESWTYFPDNVLSHRDMENYLTRNGRFDHVELSFTTDNDRSSKYYQIHKDKNGLPVAKVDFERALPFLETDFASIPEQIDFLSIHASREQDAEASKLSESERLAFYKKIATPETLQQLKEMIQGKITPARISELCQEHALRYFLIPSEDVAIEF